MNAIFPPNRYHHLNFDDIKIGRFLKMNRDEPQSGPQSGQKKFIARARYAGHISGWGIISPELTIAPGDEVGLCPVACILWETQKIKRFDIILPTTDPSFINIITEIENKTIEFIYNNSKRIYGANKSIITINGYHRSALRVHPNLGIPIMKLNLGPGTSFWAKPGPGHQAIAQESQQQGPVRINKISLNENHKIVILLRLNGVIIEGKNLFYLDWHIDQILFTGGDNPGTGGPGTEQLPVDDSAPTSVGDVESHSLWDSDDDFPELTDIGDNVIEHPDPLDRAVENNFRKRLFLKF